MLALADILRRYGPAYRATFTDRLLPSHLAAMEAIAQCRTEALGGHLSQCAACGALEDSYPSCKNRHGPQCQHEATTRWLAQPQALLLPAPSCLGTCTLPEALRPVARSHQKLMYTLRLQTSAAALQALALDPKSLGGQIGLVGGLHTWTRALAYHPPIHDLVPGGALSPDGSSWLTRRTTDWLVPVHALAKIFRGTCKEELTQAGFLAPVSPQVWKKGWVTHWKPAGTGREVLNSLAPYIHRIALTTNRLVKLEDGHVTFRYQDSAHGPWRARTLPAEAFLHRLLQHVLPKGFRKVRYDGILRPRRRKVRAPIRLLLAVCPSNGHTAASGHTWERPEPPPAVAEALHCRQCGGALVFLVRLAPTKRGPPS